MSINTPTGNVVNDPDTVWKTDPETGAVTRRPREEWGSVNPQNINEESYHGGRVKGRRKFGKIFDDEAQAQIAAEAEAVAERAAATAEQDDVEVTDDSVAHLLQDDEEVELTSNLTDVEKVLQDIKILSGALKAGDKDAEEALLDITQTEYRREDGGRQRVKGALSALGFRKPGVK